MNPGWAYPGVDMRAGACYTPTGKLRDAPQRRGKGDDASNPKWKYDYEKHRQRLETAKALVDCAPPKVVRTAYGDQGKVNRSITQQLKLERENAVLLHRIATIMKSPPKMKLDNKMRNKQDDYSKIKQKGRESAMLKIAFQNFEIWKRIQNVRPTYDRQKQLSEFAANEKNMEMKSSYPLFWKQPGGGSHPLYDSWKDEALRNAELDPRPKVFLDLETDTKKVATLIVELRADICPMTVQNFRSLCTGEWGLSYRCTKINRVITGALVQGGDVIGPDGRSGANIFGLPGGFPDENFRLKHSGPGIISMANCGKDTNGSQFIISLTKLGALDGKNVVFGKVIGGLDAFTEQLKQIVTETGYLKQDIWITTCGMASDDQVNAGEEEGEDDEGTTGPGETDEGGEGEEPPKEITDGTEEQNQGESEPVPVIMTQTGSFREIEWGENSN